MAADLEYYLTKAAEMREIADLVRDPTLKNQYFELASQYEDLARLARRADETSPPRAR